MIQEHHATETLFLDFQIRVSACLEASNLSVNELSIIEVSI
jgi:hypothetical protein